MVCLQLNIPKTQLGPIRAEGLHIKCSSNINLLGHM